MSAPAAPARSLTGRESLFGRHGALIAALAASVAALPGLWLPFLADDWINLAAVAHRVPLRTPFGYLRPLYLATYRWDWLVWGLSAPCFHATNLFFIAAAAAAVVILIERYTNDAVLAGLAGLIFALHPYHVHNAAWIAARADSLCAGLFLCAALCYDRWRVDPRGLPIVSLALFEAALLAKETAVTLPVLLLMIGLLDARRRPSRGEWLRGHMPIWLLALSHFFLLRPQALGALGLGVLKGFGPAWLWKLLGFSAGALLPVPIEALELHPGPWGWLAALCVAVLCFTGWRGQGGIPPVVWAAAGAFVVLIGPSLISFQERYFFLPSAASALGLASWVRTSVRRAGAVVFALLGCLWIACLGVQWMAWREAGIASTNLVQGLVEASRRDGVREIVIGNLPYRVGGAPVIGDFRAALSLSGGNPANVIPAAAFDYVTAESDALDGERDGAVRRTPAYAEIRLRVERGLFSRYDGPRPVAGASHVETDSAVLIFGAGDVIHVRIAPAPERGRAAYVWAGGRLEQLF